MSTTTETARLNKLEPRELKCAGQARVERLAWGKTSRPDDGRRSLGVTDFASLQSGTSQTMKWNKLFHPEPLLGRIADGKLRNFVEIAGLAANGTGLAEPQQKQNSSSNPGEKSEPRVTGPQRNPGSAPISIMNEMLDGRNVLDSLAGGLTALLTQGLRGLFGPAVERPMLGPLGWGDLAAAACLIITFILLNGLAAWVLRRKHRQLAAQPDAKAWHSQWVHAVRRPLYLFIWICAVYLASSPILVKLSSGDSLYPLRRGVDRLFGLGMFIVVFWLFFGFTRVLEGRMASWASRTNSKLDDLVVPLLGRSLRVIIPVIGIIMALPLIGLPQAYAGFVAKASSILLILTVAWILVQAVHLVEKAVLAKYDITAADNLQARKVYTQIHVLSKTVYVIIAIFTAASVLMLFEEVRRFGTSLLASAGVIGIIVGFAAQRTIANLFAGFQMAMTQPIRLDDVVVVQGEWGRIEEITLTYVVVKIWDERRLVVPLSEFIEKPFQNWTRVSSSLLGAVTVWVDYSLPLAEVRKAAQQFIEGSPLWDRRFWNLQVTDANERAMQIRVLATAGDSGKSWDLRCDLREKLISFIQERHPDGLPRMRAALEAHNGNGAEHHEQGRLCRLPDDSKPQQSGATLG